MEIEKNLIRTLEALKSDVQNLEKCDHDSLVKIGITLERLFSETPSEDSTTRIMLKLCLEGLQTIYEKNVPDYEGIIHAITETITSLIHFIQAENKKEAELETKKAWQLLWDTIANIRSQQEDDKKPCQEEPTELEVPDLDNLNMDDVAAMMATMEPSDQEGLGKIKAALTNLLDQSSIPENCAAHLRQASEELEKLLADGVTEPDEIYKTVSRQIELAIEILDEEKIQAIEAETQHENAEKTTPQNTPEVKSESEPVTVVEAPKPETVAVPSPPVSNDVQVFKALPEDSDFGLLSEFITESKEYIENAESALLSLETNPEDIESIHMVFRAFHTVKGNAAFLGLDEVNLFAHNAETFYCRIRDEEIKCLGGYADLSFRAIDMLKALINNLEEAVSGNPFLKPSLYDRLMVELTEPEAHGISEDMAAAETVTTDLDSGTEALDEKDEFEETTQISVSQTGVPSQAPGKEKTDTKAASKSKAKTDSIVRVQTERLDRLIDMVGELVIAQSMVMQDDNVVLSKNQELLKKVSHTGSIVRELQGLTMNLRMVPLKATFNKMARLMRDLARKMKKQIDFVTDGEDVELDRNMVEVINDPLVHILRNAVDHGMESPDERVTAGKDRKGTVHLRAFHSGGNVVVEIEDNGKGLAKERILQKAVSKGIIESGNNLSDHEIFNLIFEPGFSTAAKITDISGRGVGLDVVKKGVEALRGRIDVSSMEGRGTTFTMRIPITLAVTDGMLVKVGNQRYIVPTTSINMSFRPEAKSLSTIAGRGEMVMLRDKLLPIFRLHRLFNIDEAIENPREGLLVVLDDGNGGCALLVDELLGQQQVVAKSLGEAIGKVKGVSGGAILGDGKVGLILDTTELIDLAKQN